MEVSAIIRQVDSGLNYAGTKKEILSAIFPIGRASMRLKSTPGRGEKTEYEILKCPERFISGNK